VPRTAKRLLIPLALLALTGLLCGSVRRGRAGAAGSALGLDDLPLQLAGFRGRVLPPDQSVFAYLGADEMIDRIYVNPEETNTVQLSMVYSRGWRALHSPRDCYKNQGWALIQDDPCEIALGDGDAIHGKRLVMDKPGLRFVAVYTFVTGRATTGSWFLHSARMALGARGKGGALIAAVAPSGSSATDPQATLAAEGIVREATRFIRQKWEGAGKSRLDSRS
jgi:EpsI family protein